MQCSEIAVSDEAFATSRQQIKINRRQQARQAIATTQRNHDLYLGMSCCGMQLPNSVGITRSKSLMFLVGAAKVVYLMPLRMQSSDGTRQCFRVSRIATGGYNGNMS
jgi:hypothetical protein